MIYKFKSKAAGDVIMLATTGDRVLGLIGKSAAAQGIIEAADMAAAISALSAAVQADDAERATRAPNRDDPAPAGGSAADAVSLRQRAWPLVEMMKRCQAAGEPIVWGV